MTPPLTDEAPTLERGPNSPAAPHPLPETPGIPEPADVDYPGTLRLHLDATDVERRIFTARQTIPVTRPGSMWLLYPKWLPGFHAPQAPIELFAGLTICADGGPLEWSRHPVTVNAFHIHVPDGVEAVEATFQFLSPTDPDQGRVLCSADMLCLPWNVVLLYPAGHYARRIMVEASLTLPGGWDLACAVPQRQDESGGETRHFDVAALDVLIDSPVLAGRYLRRIALDDAVTLSVVADEPHLLNAAPEQIAAHRGVVEQADRLFGARHFDRFDMLLALSQELSTAGIEHHRSFEAVSMPGYFTQWDKALSRRDTIPHEYVHSWNGKHRRGADSWQPCYEKPIRNSLMWVYEGQTQYWSQVLAARSDLWSAEHALGALAITAARYAVRPGSRWRPMIDTTRDPIIAARAPLPWPSWQRSEDYYSEGALMWLDVDTRLRDLSGDTRSLDDFAAAFFGAHDGSWSTQTYVFEDVVDTLNAIAPFDWAAFFADQLDETRAGAPLDGLDRGGYALVFRDTPNVFQAAADALAGQSDLTHSLGITLGEDGIVSDVLWDGPAFAAGFTIGAKVIAVGDRPFDPERLRRAIAACVPIPLTVAKGQRVRVVQIDYTGGLRFPHVERIDGRRCRIDEILMPR
ncbi:MAG TPA: peptidase M61 [Sphingomonas sp.]|jgi:predicted metalloprotease with PDZ domain|uniref:M61 family metallopeptidase n=1 Tax=Sphingomonas sp. TaxID=28214 RepID=UPI002ED9D457